jgi:hypothetical protein
MTPVDQPQRLGSIGPPTTAHDNIVCGQSFYWLRWSPIVPDRWTPVRPIFGGLCLVVVASALFFLLVGVILHLCNSRVLVTVTVTVTLTMTGIAADLWQ